MPQSESEILIKPGSNDLPRFKNPPVVETVLGVQFSPLRALTNSHMGAYWAGLKSDWPDVKNAAPLGEQFEDFGERGPSWALASRQIQIAQNPTSRMVMTHRKEDRTIQVQNNRFLFNWTGGHKNQQYPEYGEFVRSAFDEAFGGFQEFVAEEELGEIVPNQWEVTYVNHIPKGSVWNEPDEWASIFSLSPALRIPSSAVRLEGLQAEWHFEIMPQRGRLHVQMVSGRKKTDEEEEELLVLKLTARGPIDSQSCPTLGEGLDIGHETIVCAFRDLASETALDYWGYDRGKHGDS